MRQLLLIVAAASFLTGAVGLGLRFGRCPTRQVVHDFDVSRFAGKWFEVAHDNGDLGELKCGKLNVQDIDGKIHLRTSFVNTRTLIESAIEGVAEPDASLKDGRFSVQWNARSPILEREYPPIPGLILSTDYDNYGLIYSCLSLGFLSKESAVVMSRKPNIADDEVVNKKIEQALSEAKLNKESFKTTVQDCNDVGKITTTTIATPKATATTTTTASTLMTTLSSTANTGAEDSNGPMST